MITLVVFLVAAILLIGLGAFLLGTRRTSETVSGEAGVAGDASTPSDVPPGSVGVATTDPPTNAEGSTATTATPPTDPPASAVSPQLVDNSAAALADLELHFENHDRLDLEAAYTGLSTSFAPPFEEFVQFWSVAVASVDSPIDGCDVTGDRGVCAVRFFITYSDAADESVRNRCLGQAVELTMQRTDGRFLIDEQQDLGSIDCPGS